jgi:hypothetical protein
MRMRAHCHYEIRIRTGPAIFRGRQPNVRNGYCAALGCMLTLFLIFSGCSANTPKKTYRAYYGIEPPESELVTLDLGAALEAIIDDRYYVSMEKYGTVKLPAGTHRIKWVTEFGFSVMVEPSGYAAFQFISDFFLEGGHMYKFFADRTHGHGYKVYSWLKDMTTGKIVDGEKDP